MTISEILLFNHQKRIKIILKRKYQAGLLKCIFTNMSVLNQL